MLSGAEFKPPPAYDDYLRSILAKVDDQHREVRLETAKELMRLARDDENLIPILLDAIKDEDPDFCADILRCLEDLPGFADFMGPFIEKITSGLRRDFGECIALSVLALLKDLGPHASAAVPGLLEAIKDEEWEYRYRAIQTLGAIGLAGEPAIPYFVELVKSEDRGAQIAVKALGMIGKPAYPALAKLLQDGDRDLQEMILEVLEEAGPEAAVAIPGMIRAAEADWSSVWMPAIRGLGNMGERARSAVPALFDLAYTRKGSVRREAVWAILSICGGSKSAISLLIRTIDEGDSALTGMKARNLSESEDDVANVLRALDVWRRDGRSIRFAAICGISDQGPRATKALPQLLRALESGNEDVRNVALHAIAKLRAAAEPAIPALVELIHKGDLECMLVLGDMGRKSEKAVIVLAGFLETGTEEQRGIAFTCLEKIAPECPEVFPPIIKYLLEDPKRRLFQVKHEFLMKAGIHAIPILIEALKFEYKHRTRRKATHHLSWMGGTAVPALTEALKHENANLRAHAALTISWMGYPGRAAFPALIKAVKAEELEVRYYAAKALYSIKSVDSPIVSLLLEGLKKGPMHIREDAAHSLAQDGIDPKIALPALRAVLVGDSRRVGEAAEWSIKEIERRMR